MTFAPAAIPKPPPDRFRNGDFWRGPDGNLYAVRDPVWHDACSYLCRLRPVGNGIPAYYGRNKVTGWTRVSWGGRP